MIQQSGHFDYDEKLDAFYDYEKYGTERMNAEEDVYKRQRLHCTPFVRQYDILSNKWGVLLCQKEYQTNDIRRSTREWL